MPINITEQYELLKAWLEEDLDINLVERTDKFQDTTPYARLTTFGIETRDHCDMTKWTVTVYHEDSADILPYEKDQVRADVMAALRNTGRALAVTGNTAPREVEEDGFIYVATDVSFFMVDDPNGIRN